MDEAGPGRGRRYPSLRLHVVRTPNRGSRSLNPLSLSQGHSSSEGSPGLIRAASVPHGGNLGGGPGGLVRGLLNRRSGPNPETPPGGGRGRMMSLGSASTAPKRPFAAHSGGELLINTHNPETTSLSEHREGEPVTFDSYSSYKTEPESEPPSKESYVEDKPAYESPSCPSDVDEDYDDVAVTEGSVVDYEASEEEEVEAVGVSASPVFSWTEADVMAWIQGLSGPHSKFSENFEYVNGRTLLELDLEGLKALGVDSRACPRLLNEINDLKEKTPHPLTLMKEEDVREWLLNLNDGQFDKYVDNFKFVDGQTLLQLNVKNLYQFKVEPSVAPRLMAEINSLKSQFRYEVPSWVGKARARKRKAGRIPLLTLGGPSRGDRDEFAPEVRRGHVRVGKQPSHREQMVINKRMEGAHIALQEYLGEVFSADVTPRIAVAFSGGGVRAMLSTKLFLDEFSRCGLLDGVLYTVGVSGSTWCLSSWAALPGNVFHGGNRDPWSRSQKEEPLKSEGLKKMLSPQRTGPWHNSKLAPLFKHAMGEGKAGVLAWVGKSLIQALASKPLGKAGVEPAEDPNAKALATNDMADQYEKLLTLWKNTPQGDVAKRFMLFHIPDTPVNTGKRNCIDLMKEWDDFLNVFLLQSEGMCRIPSKECTFSVDTNPKLKAKYDEADIPIAICCAITENFGSDREKRMWNTVEFTPFEVSYVCNSFVESIDAKQFGKPLDAHSQVRNPNDPSYPLSGLMAIWSSFFGIPWSWVEKKVPSSMYKLIASVLSRTTNSPHAAALDSPPFANPTCKVPRFHRHYAQDTNPEISLRDSGIDINVSFPSVSRMRGRELDVIVVADASGNNTSCEQLEKAVKEGYMTVIESERHLLKKPFEGNESVRIFHQENDDDPIILYIPLIRNLPTKKFAFSEDEIKSYETLISEIIYNSQEKIKEVLREALEQKKARKERGKATWGPRSPISNDQALLLREFKADNLQRFYLTRYDKIGFLPTSDPNATRKFSQMFISQRLIHKVSAREEVIGKEYTVAELPQFGHKKIVVEAAAGLGKSTFCRSIARNQGDDAWSDRFQMVILVELKELKGILLERPWNGLQTIIAHYFGFKDIKDKKAIIDCLEDCKDSILWIFDGFDEVDEDFDPNDIKITKSNDSFNYFLFQLLRGQLSWVEFCIISTRPEKKTGFPKPFEVLQLQPWGEQEMNNYVDRFFKRKSKSEVLTRLKQVASASRGISPLLCDIVCTTSENSKNLGGELTIATIFEDIIDMIANMSRSLQIGKTPDELIADVQKIAYEVFFRKGKDKTVSLHEDLQAALISLGLFKQVTRRTKSQKVVEFSHQVFLEYLCAKELDKNPADGLAKITLDPSQQMLLQFIANIWKDKPERWRPLVEKIAVNVREKIKTHRIPPTHQDNFRKLDEWRQNNGIDSAIEAVCTLPDEACDLFKNIALPRFPSTVFSGQDYKLACRILVVPVAQFERSGKLLRALLKQCPEAVTQAILFCPPHTKACNMLRNEYPHRFASQHLLSAYFSNGKESTSLIFAQLRQNIANFSMMKVGNKGVKFITETIDKEVKDVKCQTFDIHGSELVDDGVAVLLKSLQKVASLTCLNLGKNPFITEESMHQVASFLKTNTSLQELVLDGCPIGDRGAQFLSQALEANQSLVSLNLSNCKIGKMGAQALAKSLQSNTSLTSLGFFGNIKVASVANSIPFRPSIMSWEYTATAPGRATRSHYMSTAQPRATVRYELRIIRGMDLAQKDPWPGLSDPYVNIYYAGGKKKTSTKMHTLNPEWHESIYLTYKPGHSTIKLEVYDYDAVGDDDFMGEFEIPLADTRTEVTKELCENHTEKGKIGEEVKGCLVFKITKIE